MKTYAARTIKGKKAIEIDDPETQVIDLRFDGARIVRILIDHGAPPLSAHKATSEILEYVIGVIQAAGATRLQ